MASAVSKKKKIRSSAEQIPAFGLRLVYLVQHESERLPIETHAARRRAE